MPLKSYSCVFEMCSAVIIYTSLTPRCSELAVQKRESVKKAWGVEGAQLGMWRMEGRLYRQVRFLGLICLMFSKIKVEFSHCSWPFTLGMKWHLTPGEFGREGQLLFMLYGKTEVIWEIVSGDLHGTICNFSHSLQLHRETQKLQVIHTAQYKPLKY